MSQPGTFKPWPLARLGSYDFYLGSDVWNHPGMEFLSEFSCRSILLSQEFSYSPWASSARHIRSMYETLLRRYASLQYFADDRDPMPLLIEAIRSRRLVAVAAPLPCPPSSVHEPEPLPKEPAPAEVRAPANFDLQVVLDATGRGVGDVWVELKDLGRGDYRPFRTDREGRIHLEHVLRGTADVRASLRGARLDQCLVVVGWGAAPLGSAGRSSAEGEVRGGGPAAAPTGRYLIELEDYQVRDGDTTSTLANRAMMPWEELAYFNWGTRQPSEVEEHVEHFLGPVRRDARGKGLVFAASDTPRLLRIPRAFSKENLPTDTQNVLRVERPRLPFGRCLDGARQAISGKRFVVYEGGREVYAGKTDAAGWLRAPFPWTDRYDVSFPRDGSAATGGGRSA